jgi:hypothetical protein
LWKLFMSALGHKRTFWSSIAMSAFPRKRHRIRIFGRQLRANSGHREERSALHINAWSKKQAKTIVQPGLDGATYCSASHPDCAQRDSAIQLHVYRGALGQPCVELTLDFSQLAYSSPEKSLPGLSGFCLRPAVLPAHRQRPREIATFYASPATSIPSSLR